MQYDFYNFLWRFSFFYGFSLKGSCVQSKHSSSFCSKIFIKYYIVLLIKKNEILKTFLTSFMQVGCVAINTYFITQLNWIGIFIASFTISLLWAFNVSKISVSTTNQKLTYALGAGCGAIVGLALVKLVL